MAEINEILSKEAIEGIRTADKYITQFDVTLKAVILSARQFDAAFKGQAASIQVVAKAQKTLAENTVQATAAKKKQLQVVNELSAADRKAAAELEKRKKKEEELTAALKLNVKSVNKAVIQNKALKQAKKKL